ncbi:MAG: two-component regulator propeller domain-containing protein [Terriglobales bacterium]
MFNITACDDEEGTNCDNWAKMYFHMGKTRTQGILSLAILLACCACAFALDPSLDISQYAHTSWKVRDGFTKGTIYSIAQTPDGYLWLATEFGLYRFDGVRVVPWQPPPGQKLPSDTIFRVLVGRDGTLWIGTTKGLASWKDGRLTTYPEMAGQAVGRLVEDREGTIWAGTTATPSPGQLCAIRNGSVQCEGKNGTFATGISGLYEDTKGILWVGLENGFWRWKPGASEFFSVPGQQNFIRAFAESDEGALLIGARDGIKQLVNGRVETYRLPGPPLEFQVTQLLRDHDGSLWVGTFDQGLLHLHQGKTDVFTQGDGLSSNVIERLFEDREGSIWVPTFEGLERFRPYAVPTLSVRQGLAGTVAWSVLAEKDGSVWIGTMNGLSRWQGGQVSLFGHGEGARNPDGKLNGLLATSLFEDSSGRVWVGTRDAEFGYLENSRFVPALRDLPNGVTDVVELSPGHMWITAGTAGLFHLFKGKVIQRIPWAGLGHSDFASPMVADPSRQGIWLGFYRGGVAYFADGGLRESYSASHGIGEDHVTQLRFGSRGALWAATQGGLSRIKDGHVSTLTSRNGLPCDTVNWSMEDDDHSMWLYMPCGLMRISRSEMDGWAADTTRTVKFALFDASDGVRSHYAAGGYRPLVTKSPDGKIWFAALDGVSVIDPRHLPFNKLPPPVHIEKVTADDKTYDLSNGAHLPAQIRNLDIDYTALSLVVPEKVRFRVKLEGQDKDWRELVNVRHVEYTNLPPKHYKFRVLACNNSGVWNEEGAALDFVIPPAWYQTNWFRAGCVAAFLAMIWGIYELRVRQLAAQFNMRLEERVAERTRVARDLHDTLLQSFQALLPSLQAGINMLAARPADARKVLEATADHASQAIAEGRDAVQGLRMSTVEKNDLAIAIRTIGEELASAASAEPSPNFNVVVEGASRNLHPILRDEVYRLTVEALRNAFRHAAAQNVEVEIRYDEKYFRLRVRDDGKGIPSDVLSGDGREGHYGLPGMRERAKLVGGKLAIWTELDGGTEIELNIPGARAYVKSTRTFWHFGKRSATDTDEKEPIERE